MKLLFEPDHPRNVAAAADFGKVAVLLGGASTEREISLLTGKAVLAALLRRSVNAQAFDPAERPLENLLAEKFDRVWIALHGPGGEDGAVQGALEFMGMPYTGSGVLGSAIAMDKVRTKQLAIAVGIATAEFVVLESPAQFDDTVIKLGLPLVVKPATQGSSVGISKVMHAQDLPAAFAAARAVDRLVMAEPWLTGGEYTVAILHGRALPSIRIETPKTFYDYEAKYFRDDTRYLCPSGLGPEAEKHMGALAKAAFNAVGAFGWGRVDFMMDRNQRPLLLEINTVPGMTDHSLVPMAARAVGIDFETLAWKILETSFARRPLC
jgi:D-alanine-D-alanine ligase